ncbi:MAG: hypothetical protein HC862_20645 [Scytonema sp. RU_4_4]|nr:hypothetical protein [Scytonema sp. RU_4_4]NJR75060.1 hypothetical protein [Scytonema sp. CRU_2_7]
MNNNIYSPRLQAILEGLFWVSKERNVKFYLSGGQRQRSAIARRLA